MSESYASIVLGGEGRNTAYLGIFVAWLVSNGMLSEAFERQAGSAVARLRLQDMTGAGFLTTVLHGELKPVHLNETGQKFVERYFLAGGYRHDFDASVFDGDDEWSHYDVLAPKITAAFRKQTETRPSLVAKILQFPGKRRD